LSREIIAQRLILPVDKTGLRPPLTMDEQNLINVEAQFRGRHDTFTGKLGIKSLNPKLDLVKST
jgi:hypothetical protein